MNKLPKIRNYGQYSSENYVVNSLMVDLGEIDLYYSYETIVAYRDAKDGLVCSENRWGVTTGKHLNWIQSNKKARLASEQFDEMLKNALARHIN